MQFSAACLIVSLFGALIFTAICAPASQLIHLQTGLKKWMPFLDTITWPPGDSIFNDDVVQPIREVITSYGPGSSVAPYKVYKALPNETIPGVEMYKLRYWRLYPNKRNMPYTVADECNATITLGPNPNFNTTCPYLKQNEDMREDFLYYLSRSGGLNAVLLGYMNVPLSRNEEQIAYLKQASLPIFVLPEVEQYPGITSMPLFRNENYLNLFPDLKGARITDHAYQGKVESPKIKQHSDGTGIVRVNEDNIDFKEVPLFKEKYLKLFSDLGKATPDNVSIKNIEFSYIKMAPGGQIIYAIYEINFYRIFKNQRRPDGIKASDCTANLLYQGDPASTSPSVQIACAFDSFPHGSSSNRNKKDLAYSQSKRL